MRLFAKFLLLAVCVMLFAITNANAQSSNVKKGNSYFEKFDFKTAILYYKKAIDKNAGDLMAQMKLADCYRLLNDPVDAEAVYKTLYDMDADIDPSYKYNYALTLRSNQKFDEAKVVLDEYNAQVKDDASAKSVAAGLAIVDKLSTNNPAYDVQLAEFNSDKSDFGTCISGDKVIFATNRGGGVNDKWTDNPFLQLYETSKEQSTSNYTDAVLYSGKYPNGKFHDGPVCIDPKTSDMYITRSNYTGTKPVKADDKQTVNLKIYRLAWIQEEGRYSDNLEEFPYNSNNYSCGHATITADGQYLFFASDMPDNSKGGVDIFMCQKSGNSWGAPQNVTAVNTKADEMFPFIATDNVLYFASDGQFGLGGLDIYYAKWVSDNKWDRVANMGAPVNTSYDDFAMSLDESAAVGFFSSNRPGGVGDDDIYHFRKTALTICGEVYDAQSGEKLQDASVKVMFKTTLKDQQTTDADGHFCASADPNKTYTVIGEKTGYFPNQLTVSVVDQNVEVKIPLSRNNGINLEVTVIDSKTKQPINMSDVVLINAVSGAETPKVTDANGKTFFTLDPNSSYNVMASKADVNTKDDCKYLNNSTTISTKNVVAPANLYATIELRNECKIIPIKIENIYYDLDKYFIRPDAAIELDKLVKILKDNPTMEIELSSHTDCRASKQYNMWLSAKRAESAVNYLIKNGIDPQRLIAAGYGETRLVNECDCEDNQGKGLSCTEAQHQDNRRTEFTIIKF